MAIIKPFKALRPKKEFAEKVASVPYDVVNRAEAFDLAKDNEYSLLNITRSEIHFDESLNPYSSEVYKKAKEKLQDLINKNVLYQESEEHFYLYKLEMGKQIQTGLVGVFSVDDYKNDVIKKHEKTRKEKEDDRTNHILTTEAQTGPVFLTYHGVPDLNNIFSNFKKDNLPENDFTSSDGIKHTIWKLPVGLNNTIIEKIKSVNNLYIADGHHRAASAARSCDEKRKMNPNYTGKEDFNYFIAVLFPAEELKILPYNRIVFNLNNNSQEELFKKIQEYFTIEETNIKEPQEKRSISMYLNKKWYKISATEKIKSSSSPGENLDVSILQKYILNPILGVDDPRTSKKIDFVGGIRGTQELEKLVDSGKAAIAFSMYPVSINDLISISDAGEVMPPKSTWFEPKLRDGLLIHLI